MLSFRKDSVSEVYGKSKCYRRGKVTIRQLINKAIKFYFCSTDIEFGKEFCCFLGHLGGDFRYNKTEMGL